MSVNTSKTTGRRKLRFQNLDEVVADAERLAAMPTRPLGNWSLGQICKHLAETMNQSIDGFEFQASLPIRMVARLIKGRYLNRGLTPGFRLPRRAVRLLPSPTETQEGLGGAARGRGAAEAGAAPRGQSRVRSLELRGVEPAPPAAQRATPGLHRAGVRGVQECPTTHKPEAQARDFSGRRRLARRVGVTNDSLAGASGLCGWNDAAD